MSSDEAWSAFQKSYAFFCCGATAKESQFIDDAEHLVRLAFDAGFEMRSDIEWEDEFQSWLGGERIRVRCPSSFEDYKKQFVFRRAERVIRMIFLCGDLLRDGHDPDDSIDIEAELNYVPW